MEIIHRHPEDFLTKAAITVAAGLLVVSGCSSRAAPRHSEASLQNPAATAEQLPVNSVDLLAQGSWNFPGAAVKLNPKINKKVLEVSYSGQKIVKQDGSPGYDNPPLNLFGSYIGTSGDFRVGAKVNGTGNHMGLNLYGQPPFVEDEFRAEKNTLEIQLGDRASYSISNQKNGLNAEHGSQVLSKNSEHIVTIDHVGNTITISVDNIIIADKISDDGLFDLRKIWFGFNTSDQSVPFSVTELNVEGINGGKVSLLNSTSTTIEQSTQGFSQLAHRRRPGFIIGTTVALGPMIADQKYLQLLGNYNGVTTENAGKFQFIHPLPGNAPSSYSFSEMDALVSIANRSQMQIHGHTLVFGEANPQWVQDIAQNHPEQLKQVMVDHISTVVTHYKGRVRSWDVVNEPLADYDTQAGVNGLRQNIWYNAMGPQYISLALQAAHNADPSAELYINDFGMESDDNRFSQMVELVKSLRQQGVPLTGIGFQAHIDATDTISSDSHIDTAKLRDRIKTLELLGAKVRFSELDVSNESEYPVYSDITGVCLSEPNCVGVTTWGISNGESSSASINKNGIVTAGIGLPYDETMQPLQPVTEIKKALTR